MSTCNNRRCMVPQPNKENAAEPGFKIDEAAIPDEIENDHVLLKVLVCGICHSDTFTVLGQMGGSFPAVPGHEVIGKVVKVGAGDIASTFAEGAVVGVGWHGDHCLSCEACSDGDFICCQKLKVSGIHIHGGYQEYMVAPAKTLARVPEGMDPVIAAPIMCAGVTVFNGLRSHNDKANPPALVAVVGIGGLGHLAIQFAAKMGYTVVAVSRGTKKKDYALELGATHYIDSEAENSSEALQSLGGAKMILCTATNAKVMEQCIDGLGRNGKLVVLGIPNNPISVMGVQLIPKRCSLVGHPAGAPRDSQVPRDYQVTQLRTEGVHCRESSDIGVQACPGVPEGHAGSSNMASGSMEAQSECALRVVIRRMTLQRHRLTHRGILEMGRIGRG